MELPRFPLVSCLPFLAAGALSAQIASDDAGNYASWTAGSNNGSGFGAWSLNDNNDPGNNVFAGFFLGDSTAGAGDINTGGQSFAMYANPGGAFATAARGFGVPLVVGNTFSVELGVNFNNGSKGFNLFDGNGDQLFGFNVGGASPGAQINTDFTNNPNAFGYDYGGAAGIDIVIDYAALNELSYTVSRDSPQGIQGVLFDGEITGSFSAPTDIEFYVSDTDPGGAPQNDLYFNNLEVVPEPSSAALVAAVGVLFVSTVCRRGQG